MKNIRKTDGKSDYLGKKADYDKYIQGNLTKSKANNQDRVYTEENPGFFRCPPCFIPNRFI
jgi:hypothetical protein